MILFGASCLVAATAIATVIGKDPTPTQLAAIFAHFDRSDSPGCAVSVERDGQVLYTKGFGMANLEYAIPNTPSTVFHVASLSKQFTAFAIQLLVEDGKLRLDDDIRKYVPEMHDFGKTITIQNLLHHTSGLRDQWNLVSLGGWRMDDVITQDDLLNLLSRQTALSFNPGSKYIYCNSGYTLLALIVQRVSKSSLAEFCEKRIFVPLAMSHTHFHDDYQEIVPNRAASYDPKDGGGFQIDVLSYSNVGATSLFTTVEDFARWAHNFDDAKVGGPNVMKRMLETVPLTDGRKSDYACGLSIGSYRGLPTIEHSGADAGFRSDFLRFPDQKLSISCFANVGNAAPNQLVRHIAQEFLGSEMTTTPASPEPQVVKVSDSTLKTFAGCFQFNPDSIGVFDVKDGKFRVHYAGRKQIVLQALSQTSFISPGKTLYEFTVKAGGMECRRTEGTEVTTSFKIPNAVISPDYLGAFVGEYYSDELQQIYRVNLTGNTLRLDFVKNDGELKPIAEGLFAFDGWVVRFERNKQSQVVRLFMSSGRSYNIQFDRVTLKKA